MSNYDSKEHERQMQDAKAQRRQQKRAAELAAQPVKPVRTVLSPSQKEAIRLEQARLASDKRMAARAAVRAELAKKQATGADRMVVSPNRVETPTPEEIEQRRVEESDRIEARRAERKAQLEAQKEKYGNG